MGREPPIPPAQTFVLPGPAGLVFVRFFVIPGRTPCRRGELGHYLRPMRVTDWGECIPFPSKERNVVPDTGANPLFYAGLPGFPLPPPAVRAEIERRERAWREDPRLRVANYEWIPRLDGWGWANPVPVDKMNKAARMHPTDRRVPCCFVRDDYNTDDQFKDREWHNLGPRGATDPAPYLPNLEACEEGEHYVRAPWRGDPSYFEVGRAVLEEAVEAGERLDFAFAQKMQGLLGLPQDAVWACLDPSFNPADRKDALHQFVNGYTLGFYGSVSFDAEDDAREVAVGALQEHRAFCQARFYFSMGWASFLGGSCCLLLGFGGHVVCF